MNVRHFPVTVMSTPQPTDQAAFNLDAAKVLQSKLEGLGLHISNIRDDFNSKPVDGLEDWLGEGLGSKIPSAIAADVASQMVRGLGINCSQNA